MRSLPLDKVSEFEKKYISVLNCSYADVMAKIKQGQLDDEITAVLRKVAAEVCDMLIKA